MDKFGKISSIDCLPRPQGQHVKHFDAAQKAMKQGARAETKNAITEAIDTSGAEGIGKTPKQFDQRTTEEGSESAGTWSAYKNIHSQVASDSGSPKPESMGNRKSGTLSDPDEVEDPVLVPAWSKFAELGIEKKFAQAKLMTFEERDAYLRERCRAAKIEIASAVSALDRAAALIETNLPFFIVHFEEMDAQGQRSDLNDNVIGKTKWLRQNVPDISRGTFYAALNTVKARHAEQERLMLGGEVPQKPSRTVHMTETQNAAVHALLGQGYKKKDAVSMVKAAEGQDFASLFKSALDHRPGAPPPIVISSMVSDAGTRPPAPVSDQSAPEQSQSKGVDKIAERQPDPQIAKLREELKLVKAENASLLQRLQSLQAVPEYIKDDQITATLAAEPDTFQASKLLRRYLANVGQRVLPPHMALGILSVDVQIVGRQSRIVPNDFLEKRNKSPMPPTLCKCSTEVSEGGRKKVSEWQDGKWGKSYVIYHSDESTFRVITPAAARQLAPEAFLSTPSPAVRL